MTKKTEVDNFLEFLKKQKWLIPVLLVIFLLLVGSMVFLSKDTPISPVLYQKF